MPAPTTMTSTSMSWSTLLKIGIDAESAQYGKVSAWVEVRFAMESGEASHWPR